MGSSNLPTRRFAPTSHEWGGQLREVLGFQQLPVARVRQALDRIGHRHPGQLVDLGPRLEAAALGLHEPVAGDLVAAAPVDVGGATERPLDLAAKPGLFADLAHGAVLRSLVRLDFAFGQSPVVVCGAMNDSELRLAGWIGAVDDAA